MLDVYKGVVPAPCQRPRAGCTNIISWPLYYKGKDQEKAVIGGFDPSARKFMMTEILWASYGPSMGKLWASHGEAMRHNLLMGLWARGHGSLGTILAQALLVQSVVT